MVAVLEREFRSEDGTSAASPFGRHIIVPALIDPHEHPSTAPQHTRIELPPQSVLVEEQTLTCSGYRLQATGNFHEWGTGVDVTVYTNDAIPGKVIRVELKTNLNGQPAEFSGGVVEFLVVPP